MFPAAASAEPNVAPYQLQESCEKSAADVFAKDYNNGIGDDGYLFNYQAHYKPT
jgi:hypothetical protein